MKRTVKCKLEPAPEQAAALTATLETFALACNAALVVANDTGNTRAFDLHKVSYRQLKDGFGLTANYVVRAIARVAQSFGKGKRTPKEFRPTSLDLDKDLLRYNPHNETVSLASIHGRLKGVRVRLGNYQRQLLTGQNPTAGTLFYDARRHKWYINFVIALPDHEPSGDEPLGVDLGINRILTTSDGEIKSGRHLNRVREKYQRTKASLQRKATKNAKRVLKRLSGREARFQKDVNHCLSKQVVKTAADSNRFLALEDLNGIRLRTTNKGKRLRRMIGRWAFFQLRTFIAYKAEERGVVLALVDPRNTSKSCSRCGEMGSRRKHLFSCKSCGFQGDADYNAALNIALRASVNRPKVSSLAA